MSSAISPDGSLCSFCSSDLTFILGNLIETSSDKILAVSHLAVFLVPFFFVSSYYKIPTPRIHLVSHWGHCPSKARSSLNEYKLSCSSW